jgi:hypothetical protein
MIILLRPGFCRRSVIAISGGWRADFCQPASKQQEAGATTDAQMTGFSRNPSLFKGLAVPTMKSKERSDVPGPGCSPDPNSLILACFAAGVSTKGDGPERSNISGIAYN